MTKLKMSRAPVQLELDLGRKPLQPRNNYKNLPPRRLHNSELRLREYLSVREVENLMKAAKQNRYGHRNATAILIMFRHALRVCEVVSLRWEQVDLNQGFLYVIRAKNGLKSTHPLRGIELRALRRIKRKNPNAPYVFTSARNAPLTTRTVRHIVAQAGIAAKFAFTIHPHMLRHSTGFYLANKGYDTRAIQSYMGHANIKNTTLYTEVSPKRFREFWDD